MTIWMAIGTAILVGYLIGAIPFGFIYLKLLRNVDVRTVESGRTGGTNSFRAGGPWIGLLTGASDILKGGVVIWVLQALLRGGFSAETLPWLLTLGGFCAVMGHNWPVYTGFKGGAGTSPNVGWSTAIWWPMLAINLLVGTTIFVTVGIASIISLVAAAIVPMAFLILKLTGVAGYDTWAYVVGGLATAAIITWALRPNIRRLSQGTERIVGPRAKRIKDSEMA
jgi:glycerol-3-phosphate acyltransferase PlsY